MEKLSSLNIDSLRPYTSRTRLAVVMTLAMIFSAALLLRIYAVRYGYFLNEFDPFFDYYASKSF